MATEYSYAKPVSIPRYYTVATAIRERIEAGELSAHAPIPSERALGKEFGISRMTARQAVELLTQEGFVYRDGRRGTFVAEPRLTFPIGSFTEAILRGGRNPLAQVLTAETFGMTQSLRHAFGLPGNELVHYIKRLRFADDSPIAIENTYLPAVIAPDLLERDLTGSIWRLLAEAYDVHVERAEARIEAVPLNAPEASLLHHSEAAPAHLIRRTTYDADDRPIEYARDIYRGDRADFVVHQDLRPSGGRASTFRFRP